jgi:hypothetical protein
VRTSNRDLAGVPYGSIEARGPFQDGHPRAWCQRRLQSRRSRGKRLLNSRDHLAGAFMLLEDGS